MSGSKLAAPNSRITVPNAVDMQFIASARRGFDGRISLLEAGPAFNDAGRATNEISRTKRYLTIAIRDGRSEDWLRERLRFMGEPMRDFALVYYSVYRKVFREEDWEDHGPTLDYLLDETLSKVAKYGYASFWLSAIAKDGTPVGVTTGGILPKSGTMFIGYLGVAEDYRKTGVDIALLAGATEFSAKACGLYAGKSGSVLPKYALGELEIPHSDDDGKYEVLLRIGQYGGGILAIDGPDSPILYCQPAARGLEPSRLHMYLRPLNGRMSLTKDEGVAILTEMLEYYFMPGPRNVVERKAREEVARLMEHVTGNLVLVPMTPENLVRLNAARQMG